MKRLFFAALFVLSTTAMAQYQEFNYIPGQETLLPSAIRPAVNVYIDRMNSKKIFDDNGRPYVIQANLKDYNADFSNKPILWEEFEVVQFCSKKRDGGVFCFQKVIESFYFKPEPDRSEYVRGLSYQGHQNSYIEGAGIVKHMKVVSVKPEAIQWNRVWAWAHNRLLEVYHDQNTGELGYAQNNEDKRQVGYEDVCWGMALGCGLAAAHPAAKAACAIGGKICEEYVEYITEQRRKQHEEEERIRKENEEKNREARERRERAREIDKIAWDSGHCRKCFTDIEDLYNEFE